MTELLARGPLEFELTIAGQPAGAGSKTAEVLGKRFKEARDRSGRLILKYRPASKFTAPWMEKVESEVKARWGARDPLDGALWLDAAFYELRPKSHFLSGRRLRPTAPAFPHQTDTHDRDKMVRALSDSLTNAGVIADDKRLIAGPAWKLYADAPPYRACAVLRLGRMLHQTVEEAGIESPPVDEAQGGLL